MTAVQDMAGTMARQLASQASFLSLSLVGESQVRFSKWLTLISRLRARSDLKEGHREQAATPDVLKNKSKAAVAQYLLLLICEMGTPPSCPANCLVVL